MCGVCGGVSPAPQIMQSSPLSYQPMVCDYTTDQVRNWRDKLLCATNKNLFIQASITKYNMNKYLGVVNSVVLYNNDPCLFKADLKQVYDAVLRIINLGVC